MTNFRQSIALGILLILSLPAHALPLVTNAADRDVIRDPYSSYSLNLSKGPVISVSSGNSSPAAGSLLASSFSNSASINGFLTSAMPFSFVPPPRNPQVYFALFNQPRQSNVQIGPVQVPDGAITALLLGMSLLPLLYFRRFQLQRAV